MCFISYFPVQTETNVMNKSDRFLYQETDNIEVLYGGVTHDLLSTGDVISVDFTNDGAIDHIAIITSEKIIQLILNY